jgi:hypothetical protein
MKPPYVGDNLKRLGRHSYGSRSEATKRRVAAKDAKNNTDPIAPFEYVTVAL